MSVYLTIQGDGWLQSGSTGQAAVPRSVVLTPAAILERRRDTFDIAERRPLQVCAFCLVVLQRAKGGFSFTKLEGERVKVGHGLVTHCLVYCASQCSPWLH